jgi:hypothetical protein
MGRLAKAGSFFARMMCIKTMAFAALTLLGFSTIVYGQTIQVPLSSTSSVGLTLQFSCGEPNPGISVDLDRPPAEFRNSEEVVAVFDQQTANPFSVHGFTVPIEQERERLVLDPSYKTVVRDLFDIWGQNGSNHDLTILVPKYSLTVNATISQETVSKVESDYRQACPIQ